MVGQSYWIRPNEPYQKPLKIIEDSDEPEITFPLILRPGTATSKSKALEEVAKLAAQPTDHGYKSQIRKLLDANGGVINFKGLPLESPQDFSDFLVALAGKGDNAWTNHTDVGMEVLRRGRAKYVLTANE